MAIHAYVHTSSPVIHRHTAYPIYGIRPIDRSSGARDYREAFSTYTHQRRAKLSRLRLPYPHLRCPARSRWTDSCPCSRGRPRSVVLAGSGSLEGWITGHATRRLVGTVFHRGSGRGLGTQVACLWGDLQLDIRQDARQSERWMSDGSNG